MFRNEKGSDMDYKYFGVGSICDSHQNGKYLVISTQNGVGLMSLTTFREPYNLLRVEDENYLKECEVRHLINDIGLPITFSDWSFDTKGLKP